MRESAYSLNNHDAHTAYIAACEAGRAAGQRAIEDAKVLGHNDGPAVSRGLGDSPDVITGLFAADPADPPAGWVYVQSREVLRPRRGRDGHTARAWIANHQLAPDPRATLVAFGLPHYSRSAADAGRYRIARPHVFHHEGVLWARYEGVVDGECLWTPRPLSAFHAALEAGQAEAVATDA